jgi:cytochrome o ubiquinol oxidase subunit 2
MTIPPIARNALALLPAMFLGGCAVVHGPVLDPLGTIALTERDLLLAALGLMQIVLVPVFILTFWITWRYRTSNPNGRYRPDWSHSEVLEVIFWSIPALIVTILAYLVWDYTHRLDPYKPIDATADSLEVDVVAEDWKWLFIYPKENIATVNELVFPSDRPLRLALTSDTVMVSFYVAGLGGQIFAMAGMRTELNLYSPKAAEFIGRNLQYSGDGFPKQSFAARATTASDFDAWVKSAKQSPDALDGTALAALEKPSTDVPPRYYSSVEPELFAYIIAKYAGPSGEHAATIGTSSAATSGGR